MWEKMAHIENIGYKHRKELYKHACIADESKPNGLLQLEILIIEQILWLEETVKILFSSLTQNKNDLMANTSN